MMTIAELLPDARLLGRRPRVLVVVAHPDDETFGCGSFLLWAAAVGAVTGVCCATRGEAGETAPRVQVASGELGARREHELREAAGILGVQHVDVLDFADSGMAGDGGPGALVDAEQEAVVAAVRRSVDAFAPDVLVTLDGSDGHRDHARIRDVTVAVGIVRGLPVWLHCLPRQLMRAWAQRLAECEPTSDYLALGELGTPEELVDLVVRTEEHLETRERAIAAHASQISPFEALPADLRRAFLTAEHLRAAVHRPRPRATRPRPMPDDVRRSTHTRMSHVLLRAALA